MDEDFLQKCLFFNANRLSRVITRIAEEEFAITGLTPMYGYLLRLVNGSPGVSQKDLAEKLFIAPSTVTRFVDKLEGKRLVERKVSGKTVLVYPTAKSKGLEETIRKASKSFERRYQEILGVPQSELLSQNMIQASQRLEEH